MHGLQACLFKSITVAAFQIYLSGVKMLLKGEVGGHALKSHGNYIVDHGKSWNFFLISVGALPVSAYKSMCTHNNTIHIPLASFYTVYWELMLES